MEEQKNMEKQMDTYYYQVYRDLVMQIYGGRYKKGTTLPSLKELCNIYGVGRNTVRSALQILELHGYIKTEPRKQAVVIFDMNNLNYKSFYLTDLAARREAILQTYDFMEAAFPEIFGFILQHQPKSVRMEVAGLVGLFAENLVLRSEADMSVYVLQLYKLVIALAGNQLLEQLFSTVYFFIQVPVSVSEWEKIKFRAISPLFKTTFKKFQRQLEAQDYKKLKKQIQMLCQAIKKRSQGYLERSCRNIEVEKTEGFFWSMKGMQETEYVQMASDIIEKIRTGVCRDGDILPSYARMALAYNVSEKTSRSAVELLGHLKLVSTKNGVGTSVNGFCAESREIFLTDPEMRIFIDSFFEALQILIILCRSMLTRAVDNLPDAVFEKLEQQVLKQSLTDMFCAFLPHAGLPVAEVVYEQLKRILAWGYLLDCDMKWEEFCRSSDSVAVRKASLADTFYAGCMQYYDKAKNITDTIKYND